MNTAGAADPEAVRQRAYEMWDRDGRPEGRDMDYWLRAEAALAQEAGTGLGSPPGHGPGLGESAAPGLGEANPQGSGPAAGESGAAGGQAENRAAYVQQRRTRKKADT